VKKFPLMVLTTAIAAVGVAAVAIPATATAHRIHPRRHHLWRDHPCRLHDGAYRAAGTLTNWGLTQNADGTWSGSVSIDVIHGDRHAGGQVGTTTTYTVTDARVHFGPRATDPPAANSRIQVIGRALVLRKRCTGTGSPVTETYAINRIRVHAPAAVTPTS
jgi:hypothetical protein